MNIVQLHAEKSELEGLRQFYTYMMNLYGSGLEVANWHQDGTTEALDNFLDEADAYVPKGRMMDESN